MTARFSDPHIGLVVEGPGDERGIPILLRTIANSVGEYRDVLGKPVPCKGRGSATTINGIEGYVSTAASRPGCTAVLVVLDSDKDEPEELSNDLEERASTVVNVPVRVSLAVRCFEDWILASAETMDIPLQYEGGRSGLAAVKLAFRPRSYVKPTHQPRLAHRIDVELAAGRSASLAAMRVAYLDLLTTLPAP